MVVVDWSMKIKRIQLKVIRIGKLCKETRFGGVLRRGADR